MNQESKLSDQSKQQEHPLSIGQKGLWLLHQLNPLSDRYNMPLTFKFSKKVHISDLENALNIFLKRHPILRSQFKEVKGKPVRVVNTHSSLTVSMYETDMKNQQNLLDEIRTLSRVPFDIETGPLVKAILLYDHNDRVLLLSIHHLIFDGASLKLFCDEIGQIYQDLITKTVGSAYKTDKLNYQNFQIWQEQWLQTSEAKVSQAFWLKKLSGELPQLNLPYDRGLNNNGTIRGEFLKFNIPEHITSELRSIANTYKCSEYSVWLTVYFSFLSRYTAENDLLVGTPSMGRPNIEFDHLIGYFVNLIPLRCHINPEKSFIDLLLRFKDDIYEALMHADYPLANLIDDLGTVHSRGDQPLFQTSFIWTTTEHLKSSENSLLGLSIYPLLHESGEQDFSFEVLSSKETTKGLFKYRTNCYSSSSINRIKHSFMVFLTNLCLEPESALCELPLVDEHDEQHLLFDLNHRATTIYPENCVHEIFEKQAINTPDCHAVIFEDQSVSYQRLNEQANQLAGYLIKQGIMPNNLIGLCVERSVEMFVCILGILKAGGAYVPLEPSYPKDRLQNIINNSQVKCIITQEKWRDLLSDCDTIKLFFDEPKTQGLLRKYSKDNPGLLSLSGDSLAYVIYTSGSTGNPKGVLQTHKTLVNLVNEQTTDKGLSLPMRTLQFAPFSFDVSIQEMVTCWKSGSTLVAVSQSDKDNLSGFPLLLKEREIERVFLPPQVLNWLVVVFKNQNWVLKNLKEIVVAGEALIVTEPLKAYLQQSSCCLWNHYGPTETHVVTTARIDENIDTGAAPIGSALTNLSIYILDSFQQLVPYGAVGELYVGGVGLAHGYLNNKQLTKELFIQHPYSYEENEILYRTGDLVRYINDDCLEFIGRVDEQVKINGFRIETGEVEQQLNHIDYIESAFVIAHEGPNKHKYLLAYVTTLLLDIEFDIASKARLALQTVLPSYMIPSKIIIIDELPLTTNGKVNHKLLPKPDEDLFNQSYVAPSGEVEMILLRIWSQLLNIAEDQISAQANFFELGGNSLLATQLINEVQQCFDIKIDYKDIFTYSIFRELGLFINQLLTTSKLIQKLEDSNDKVDELEW